MLNQRNFGVFINGKEIAVGKTRPLEFTEQFANDYFLGPFYYDILVTNDKPLRIGYFERRSEAVEDLKLFLSTLY